MIPHTPRMLLAAANAQVGMNERAIRAIVRSVQQRLDDGTRPEGAPERAVALDVAMIHHWGHSSHREGRTGWSSWPIVDARTANDIASFAAGHRLVRDEPAEGDLVLVFAPRVAGYVRAGVVDHVRGSGRLGSSVYFDVLSIEGDTNERGELHGGRVLRVARRVYPAAGDRFVRWADIGLRAAAQGADSVVPRRRERIAL